MKARAATVRLAVNASAIALSAIGTSASAATCVWGGGGGSYTTPAQWSCGFQPGAADNVSILTAGSIVNLTSIGAFAATLNLGSGNQFNLNNSNFYVGGAVTNNGTITIANASQFLANTGTVTFGGTGTVVLDNSVNYAYLNGQGQTFSFGSGQTVRGAGSFGVNNTYISNAGLVSADVSGATLTVDALGGNGGNVGGGLGTGGIASLYNTGTMQATGGGILAIDGGRYENSATGVIQALNGSTVSLNGDSRIVGGTLATSGTGLIKAFSASQYLQNVTLSAGSKMEANADNLYLNNGFINNGTLTIRNNTQLINELGAGGALTISGAGNIVLDNSAGYAYINGNGGTIIFGSNQSVQGSGSVGVNNTYIVNNNVFSANGGGTIVLDALGGNGGNVGGGLGTSGIASLLNNNIIEATGNSTLSIDGGRYENASGAIIRALNGSTINLGADSRILGGTLTSDVTSIFNAAGTSQYLQNVTLSAGSKIDQNSDNLYLYNAFVNNGTLTVRNNSQLLNEQGAGGALTISGAGSIVLDNSAGYAYINGNGGTIIFGSNQSVQGSGSVGVNNTYIVNNNVFSANGGGAISLDALGGNGGNINSGLGTGGNASLLNNNIIQATGNSTLSIEGGRYENASGAIIRALNGSTINLGADSRILGGTLTSDGTSTFKAFGTSQYLQDVTLSAGSKIDQNSDNLYLNNSFVNNGLLTVRNNSQLFNELGAGGALTISGSGTIALDNSAGYAYINGNGGRIVFGSNTLVTGSGSVGVNNSFIVNSNTLSFAGAGSISLDALGGNGGVTGSGIGTGNIASLVNNGVIEATGGKTVSFEGGRYENAPGAVIRALTGSSIYLNSDSRILGGTLTSDATSAFFAQGASQYLQGVTLSAGSTLNQSADNLYLANSFTNNGTLTISNGSQLYNEFGSGAALTISGSGTIALDNSAGYAYINGNGGQDIFGGGLTIRGSGNVGVNNTIITNNGLISADAGTGISIDANGGNGGIGGGVGTGGISSLLNTGTIQAANGKTLVFEGGRYENSATGTLGAIGAGSQFIMNGDANLINIQAGGILNLGNYISSTTGAASTLNIRGTSANSVSTIGTGAAGQDTVVTLSGAGSVFNVVDFGTAAATTLDSTLTTVAKSGALRLLGNRGMTIAAGGGVFSNAGFVELGGGTFNASSFTNSGAVSGFGTVAVNIANTGSVTAAGGTLATRTITGAATGTIMSNLGGIIDISAGASNSTADALVINGGLGLGARSVTVTSDYSNAAFGSGNAFNNHANVTGTGQILAANATMDLSGPLLSGGVINLGNVRTGGSSATTLKITNNGTLTDLVGAVKNTNAPGIALTGADWTANAGGGFATVGVSFTGATVGSLSGQSLDVVNNFDNVAYKTIGVTGNVYQIANPFINNASSFINVGPVLVGSSVTQALDISNSQVAGAFGFQEGLNVNWGGFSGNAIAGAAGSIVNLAAGANNNSSLVLTFDTSSAGSKSGSIAVLLATNGTGTSGLGTLALPTQNLAVSSTVITGTVLNPAVATIVSPQPITVAAQRVGGTNTAGITVRNDGAPPSAGLDGSFASATSAVSGSGSFTNIATGTTSSAIQVGVNTATSGVKTGTATLNFASNLSPNPSVALESQTVNVTGTVTELASASLFKNTGTGTFAGSGNAFTLDLGSLTTNSGIFSTDLGVLNLVNVSAYSESLGGAFAQGAGSGYTFLGNTFSGLAGGSSNTGNLLSFDTTGLGNGTYTKLVTFNGYSRYAGLTDYALTPINVNITAKVTGAISGAVPETGTWMMMLFGFGLVGWSTRRTRTAGARQLV